MKIENQNIFGGHQQFADNIYNTGSFNNAEKQLISVSDNKEEMLEKLEVLKSSKSTEEEKKKSGGYIKKFLESGTGEAGKLIIKELIENGVEYMKYLM